MTAHKLHEMILNYGRIDIVTKNFKGYISFYSLYKIENKFVEFKWNGILKKIYYKDIIKAERDIWFYRSLSMGENNNKIIVRGK